MARLLLALVLVTGVVHAKDYCQYKCNNGATNLACNNPGKPASICVGFKNVTFGALERKTVLDASNHYRSLVAKGQAKNNQGQFLPSAKNMNELVWDDDLAYLAYLNVLQCQMKHDQCRNTATQNGQNLFVAFTTATYSTVEVINKGIDVWYNEVKDVELSEIGKFNGGNGKVIGHFTQLVWGKSTRVGCAISGYKYQGFNAYLLACDYVYGNMIGESVYQAGKNCASCKACTNIGLCKP